MIAPENQSTYTYQTVGGNILVKYHRHFVNNAKSDSSTLFNLPILIFSEHVKTTHV